jgi:lysozyme
MSVELHVARLKARGWEWPILWEAVEMMARKENCLLTSYLCPAGVWTIGWGETEGVTKGMTWTPDQADARLRQQVIRFTAAVRGMCTVYTSAHELSALVVLAYNIGLRALRGSSVLRLHNQGDRAGAARAFALWNKARNPRTGKLEVLNGLVRRRAQEAAIYLTPETPEEEDPTPQAVEPESRLSASPIAQGGAVTAGGGTALGLLSVVDTAQQASTVADQGVGMVERLREALPVDPAVLLALLIEGAGVYVMWWRTKQRREGWA